MENKTTNISGQVPEQERKFAELQERVDKLERICFASKEVLNLEEAAAFLGVKKSTLYKMTHFSQIPEEAALHLSGLSVPRSERTHV